MFVRQFLGGYAPAGEAPAREHRTFKAPEITETVPSRSGGDSHEVRRHGDGHWSCTCKAYAKGGHYCWAIKQVKAEHATQPV